MKKNLLLCVLLNEDFKKSKILLLYHIMYCLNNNLDYKIIVENTEFDVFWTKIKYIQFYLHMYDNIILINSNVYVPYKSTNILKNINLNFINVKLLNNQFDNSLIIFKNDKILLGRWNTKHKKEQIDRKIYLANHDNCGPCGNVLDKHK